eukprot:CAMPEP_0196582576 /NCGR_PEP_ID=MMETSP1081-20130531/39581_1 /TAXON_ID=36882 /ORGANISM="Pyramimonas amylifera, Strain CCMP720" /LENGTH=195 /DNA_ID=CAMNT_0041903187 /DNA_START=103 /DNA_END=690 /DNA_ORIENTATION=-
MVEFKRPYGGKRKAGQQQSGGYLSNSWTTRFLPGIAVGYFLKIFFEKNKETQRGQKRGQKLGSTPTPASPQDPAISPDIPFKMVLVVRQDLSMGAGKVAAQCSHATLGVFKKLTTKHKSLLKHWEQQGQAKIVLKCRDLSECMKLEDEAKQQSLPTYMVCDAGHTQVVAGTQTVLAIGPGPADVVDMVTGKLKLY